jgi:hypothetical protein
VIAVITTFNTSPMPVGEGANRDLLEAGGPGASSMFAQATGRAGAFPNPQRPRSTRPVPYFNDDERSR